MKAIYVVFSLILICAAAPVFAAGLSLEATRATIASGDEFSLNVILDTENESVNAFEGEMQFPADILDVSEIRDGNSSVNFWIKKPETVRPGVVGFSGITPGGLQGSKEPMFSAVFLAKKSGGGEISMSGLRVLKNDGSGTLAAVRFSPLKFSVTGESARNPSGGKIEDSQSPEDFTPLIGTNPDMFGGKHFLVFSTQDKLSGVRKYQVREGDWGWFSDAESPYLLSSQQLDKRIYIKAIDNAGNERIKVLEAAEKAPWYRRYGIVVIMIILACGLLIRKIWEKLK